MGSSGLRPWSPAFMQVREFLLNAILHPTQDCSRGWHEVGIDLELQADTDVGKEVGCLIIESPAYSSANLKVG